MKLSFCIPTFNRAGYLDGALAAITREASGRDDVELIVSDNASTDTTPAIVEKYRATFPRLTYFRQDSNKGFDPNFLKAVSLASGEYCWALGDDDWVEPGAVAAVLKALEDHPGVAGMTVQCNSYNVAGERIATPVTTGAVEELRGREKIFAHRNIGYLFGNPSIQLFRRDLAADAIASKRIFHNGCSCHHLLTHLVAMRDHWLFFDHAATAWRFGNDSFMAGGLYKRAHLALTAYVDIVADVFGKDSEVYHQYMAEQETLIARSYVIRAKNVPKYNQHYKPYHCGVRERWRIHLDALKVLYPYPRFWMEVAPLYVVPGPVLPIAAGARKAIRALGGP